MGRRFGMGTDAALTCVLIAAVLALWAQRGHGPNLISLAVGVAAPSIAGLALIALVAGVPSLTGAGPLTRPQTYCLPAIHTALTLLATKSMLTSSNPTAAIHELLRPATLWLQPTSLVLLFAFGWLALEITHLKNRVPVS